MIKKLLAAPALIIGGGALALLGLPWWMVAVSAIAAGLLFPTNPGKAFSIGFAAGFTLWWSIANFFNSANGGLLAGKMGALFSGLQSWHLLVATGILGGLLAGLGNLTGVLARQLKG